MAFRNALLLETADPNGLSKVISRISAADLFYQGHQLPRAMDGDECLGESKEHREASRGTEELRKLCGALAVGSGTWRRNCG